MRVALSTISVWSGVIGIAYPAAQAGCFTPYQVDHSSAPARYTTYFAGTGRQRAYRSAFSAARSAACRVDCRRDAYRGDVATTTRLPMAARSSLTSQGRGP
jgi:hypothetical protein